MKRCSKKALVSVCALLAALGSVQVAESRDNNGEEVGAAEEVSPARRIHHNERRGRSGNLGDAIEAAAIDDQRSIDGTGNNLAAPDQGAAFIPLLRLAAPDYADGVSQLAGALRPSAREVSNLVIAQEETLPNSHGVTDFLWQWGQFLDHDLDLTDGVDPPEPADIAVPEGDPFFDPDGNGDVTIPFNRSLYDPESGTDSDNPRQQENEITAWIDASNVYGSDGDRAAALRANDGTGRLATSAGDLLPFNTAGLPNAGGTAETLFLAGDVRANEQIGLTVMHTLFVREHNRLAEMVAAANPELTGEQIYQKARQLVGAEMQAITYNEYLPALMGENPLDPYTGYDPDVNAGISNLFSTAAYRYGHSALSPQILRLNAKGREIDGGHLALRDAFFAPQLLSEEGDLDPILRGLASQICQTIDPFVIDDVRNFLFGPPGAGGFDLAALNIQRGRDHGLPSYNDARVALGLAAAESFADVSSDPEIQSRLAAAYGDVSDMDVWVGGLAEDPVNGGMLGELFFRVLKDQFEALRDGDRFWYELVLTEAEAEMIDKTLLSKIIRANTGVGNELQKNVFVAPQDNDGSKRRRR